MSELADIFPSNVNVVEAGIFNPPIAYVTSVDLPKMILFDPFIELPNPMQVELLNVPDVVTAEHPIIVLFDPVVKPVKAP